MKPRIWRSKVKSLRRGMGCTPCSHPCFPNGSMHVLYAGFASGSGLLTPCPRGYHRARDQYSPRSRIKATTTGEILIWQSWAYVQATSSYRHKMPSLGAHNSNLYLLLLDPWTTTLPCWQTDVCMCSSCLLDPSRTWPKRMLSINLPGTPKDKTL